MQIDLLIFVAELVNQSFNHKNKKMRSIKSSMKTVTNLKSIFKKRFNLLNQNVMKTNILTAAALLLFTTASIAQTEEGSKPELEKRCNHIEIEAGTGS